MNFIVYYIKDVIPAHPNYTIFGISIGSQVETAAGIFMVTALILSAGSGYLGGHLGDAYGKKKLVYLSAALQVCVCVCVCVCTCMCV